MCLRSFDNYRIFTYILAGLKLPLSSPDKSRMERFRRKNILEEKRTVQPDCQLSESPLSDAKKPSAKAGTHESCQAYKLPKLNHDKHCRTHCYQCFQPLSACGCVVPTKPCADWEKCLWQSLHRLLYNRSCCKYITSLAQDAEFMTKPKSVRLVVDELDALEHRLKEKQSDLLANFSEFFEACRNLPREPGKKRWDRVMKKRIPVWLLTIFSIAISWWLLYLFVCFFVELCLLIDPNWCSSNCKLIFTHKCLNCWLSIFGRNSFCAGKNF